MKKLVALCLACMLALLCAGGLAEVSKDGLPISEEKITLTGLVSSDPKVGDWNENPTVKLFEERTNIHVDWESVPAAGFAEKRNLLFASNELPDIIMRAGLSSSLEAKYAANGQLLALDELLDYAPNLRALMEQNPIIAKNITSPDGHIYSLPQLNTTEGNLINNYYINKDWLEKLNLEMPRTLEELKDVLRHFVQDDPNGNGVADEIGFAGTGKGGVSGLLGNFYGSFGMGLNRGVIDGYFQINDDNKVEMAALTDNYRKMVSYFHELWQEGLMDKDSFSQDYIPVSAKANLDQVGFVNYGNNNLWLGACRGSFVQPPVLAGPDGYHAWVGVNSLVQTNGAACITAACKNPEAAMRYLDYFYSKDGTLAIRMGIEGKSYYVEDGKYKLYDFIANDPNGLTLDEALCKWGLFGGGCLPQYITDEVDMSAAQNADTKADVETLRPDLIDPESLCKLLFSSDEAFELSVYQTDILNFVQENIVKFITGERDLAEWDDYVSQVQAMGLEQYLAIYQAAYDRWLAQ